MVYIANCTSQYFICKAALMELGLLDRSFLMPQTMPQRCEDRAQKPKSSGEVLYQEERQCKCPARCIPPEPPTKLPMPATAENIPKLKKCIEEKYASSAFNVCTHQVLPLVNFSPPLRLFMDPNAKHVAVHKPATVPLHFTKEVCDGLDKDECLGVIERVQENTLMTWCSRMCMVVKKNSSLRRMVDFHAVNDAAPRQTHPVEPPFQQVSSVPSGTWKTCMDA